MTRLWSTAISSDELYGAGCEVAFWEGMQEKALTCDRALLWHGSLNLIPNTGPTHLMMRFTDCASCERASRVVERARKGQSGLESPRAATDRRNGDAAPVGGHDERQRTSARSTDGIKPGDVVDGRLCLAVRFLDGDEAKRQLGAQWGKLKALW